MFGIGYVELMVLLTVAVVLFGRKLPEVAKNVGSSYAQFRKGLSEIQTSIELETEDTANPNLEYEQSYDDITEPSGPKFEPPSYDDEDETSSDASEDNTDADSSNEKD